MKQNKEKASSVDENTQRGRNTTHNDDSEAQGESNPPHTPDRAHHLVKAERQDKSLVTGKSQLKTSNVSDVWAASSKVGCVLGEDEHACTSYP